MYVGGICYLSPRFCARRLCTKLGIKAAAVTKPSKHLPYEHSEMEKVRFWVRHCADTHNIHPRLICNMDQVWSTHYECPKRTLYKPQPKRGICPTPYQKPSVGKIVDDIKKALGLAPPNNEAAVVQYTPKHPVLNAEGNLNPVDYHRLARTTTTISWCDGTLSTAYVTATNKSIPQNVVKEMNEELKGVGNLVFVEIHRPCC